MVFYKAIKYKIIEYCLDILFNNIQKSFIENPTELYVGKHFDKIRRESLISPPKTIYQYYDVEITWLSSCKQYMSLSFKEGFVIIDGQIREFTIKELTGLCVSNYEFTEKIIAKDYGE